MNRQVFNELLQRYLNGSCTEQERLLVDRWFEAWKEDLQQPTLSEAEWQQVAERMWSHISQQTTVAEPPVVIPLYRRKWMQMAAAVAVLLVGVLGSYYYFNYQPQENFRATNTSTKPKQLLLPDGSKVILYANAGLQFPDAFTDSVREVTLQGDAFFDVVHNPQKAFYVKTNHLIIKVLGTSFFVRQKADAATEVAVRSGRVAVSERYSANASNNGVLLTPNQKVVYHAQQQHFVTALVEKPAPVVTALPAFKYQEAPLSQVINDLQTTYQIQISLENNKLTNCNLTGDLSQMDMYAQLEALTRAIGASYQIKGTAVLIVGKGCD
ncbi:MAG: FecR domain-containing protein [Cytophagales bacterium]|nr:FecR domain-containing protein [Cytophagales bacterium]